MLAAKAAEEIVRWTSPVIQFTRIVNADTMLAGQQIRENDVLALFYPSAARDEAIFERPNSFEIELLSSIRTSHSVSVSISAWGPISHGSSCR